MAIILRVGTRSENAVRLAEGVLARLDGLEGLVRASFDELCAIHGLGEAKVAQLQAALELGRRVVSLRPEERLTVRSPADVANLLQVEMGFLEQEHLRVVLLNTRNQVLDIPEVYRGNVNSSLIKIGEVFREAVRRGCPALIVVHNHPSGDPSPSDDDAAVTRQLVEAGKVLDIEVLDHLVIGRQGFVSLKERGLGFNA
jgi:DNA repair protein RadC